MFSEDITVVFAQLFIKLNQTFSIPINKLQPNVLKEPSMS